MKCNKCSVETEEIFVLKRGQYQNKPLCTTCFNEEKEILLGE